MFPVFTDWTFLILIPAMLLAFYAQGKVKAVFEQYFREPNTAGLSGAEAAERLIRINHLQDVRVEKTQKGAGDHYDPREKVIRLSPVVYSSTSLTSLGVVAHEVGHAVQHAEGYVPLALRNTLAPVTGFSSTLAFPFLLLGLLTSLSSLVKIGILVFLAVAIFQIITLPVEYNASRRALTLLEANGMVKPYEFKAINSVLNAAALTYVAAALMAVSNLVMLSGFYRNRN
ncbi:MAG: zinc metallopeptidase [Peptococcaceae bacterium]|nr:zinc metallopeptidase [Peptococcaceae bacterium]